MARCYFNDIVEPRRNPERGRGHVDVFAMHSTTVLAIIGRSLLMAGIPMLTRT
ncbi:hypothetical protein GEOBRER4_n3205 [Citrifermentans bremense]|uniref:Uncharacterized protein n=1 Tax=Citrifermentans bremense TaxID=60035 RepID=A0A7R7FT45_9BACT|nr:hypothetical protein GEOBRER4_n3205 [Citrifermentans bremense]